jgi:hypothetical protein
MKIWDFFLLVTLFISGCSSDERGMIKYDSKTIKASFSDTKEVLATDIIDSIQYVKLEDTKEPIGNIQKMLIDDNKIMLWDNSRKSIWVYTSEGKIIGQISRFGGGPEEYASIYNFSFTAPDKIHIIDGVSRAIKTYSTTGKFISQEKTEGYACDYIESKNKKYSFLYSLDKNNGQQYYFNVRNTDNTNIGFFDYRKPFMFVKNGGDFILKSNDLLYLRQPYNDTIYSLNNNQLTAKYTFDFGKNSYPSKDIYNAKNLQEVDKILSKKVYEGNASNVLISKKYITALYFQQKVIHELYASTLIHNTQTNKTCTYYMLNRGEHEISLEYPMATDGEYFYFARNSFELPEQVIKRYKGGAMYDENSNPTIIKYKYKL